MAAAALIPLSLFAADVTLVNSGATWKYRDVGTDEGTAWRAPAFDDSAWVSGTAQFGYGDGDETTVVSYGGDPNDKHITTYFRHAFNVADPSAFTALTLQLMRDDGAVVYLNGTEVMRSNMPSGTVSYRTGASSNVGGADELTFFNAAVSPSLLVAGRNVVAVEVHQVDAFSSDVSFDLRLIGTSAVATAEITRGPYLQIGTANGVQIRWRTSAAVPGRVRYGTAPTSLGLTADGPTTTEHQISLSGLSPSTTYYYSVGTPTETLAGDSSYFFVTSPPPGSAVPARVWVVGDSGTADSNAAAVRNAYYNFAGSTHTSLWLMLGDNAYEHGLDQEYQVAVFDMFSSMLRKSVLWPTIGNHDTAHATTVGPDLPYFQMFSLPTAAEAGGIASGTEKYYSFDYGNIHFVCLDSMTSDRSPTGPMLTWLRNDLMSTTQQWIIAFWHHPPYSRGSHDSDWETELYEMRQNALPILEDFGVDLVLAGHSHSYERSFLLDSHYGMSNSLISSMKKDAGSGRPEESGPYRKGTLGAGPHEGAVYAVAGSSGMATGGPLNHPAMFISLNYMGSMVLDVNGGRLDAKFLRENGVVADSFTIIKGPPAAPTSLTATASSSTRVDLQWSDNANGEDGYRIERCSGSGCTSFTQIAQTAANVATYADTTVAGGTTYRYRVRAYAGSVSSAYTNTATVTTAATCTAPSITTQPQSTSITSGQSTTLSVVAGGTAPLAYQWFAGNTAISGATGSSITVSPTSTTSYFVRVTNGCGTADSNTATVTVCNPASITTQPQSTSITAGQSTTLSVVAGGTAPLAYQWFANGAAISNANASAITVAPASTTSYSVRVSNGCGTVVSNTATVTVTPVPVASGVWRDFERNGRADVFWRDESSGTNLLWSMNGTSGSQLAASFAPTPWRPSAFGDFDGDGRTDVLWRQPSTGETSLWLMDGPRYTTAVRSITVGDVGWTPSGSGDFNGDGRADLFWHNATTGQNSIWLMNGIATDPRVVVGTPPEWDPLLFGDFDGDGRADVFWRSRTTGETSIWLMNGDAYSTAVRSITVGDLDWQPLRAGDFDGDRRADIFWWNRATGETSIWLMSGTTAAVTVRSITVPQGWSARSAGDYDGDGKADLFWHNASTGQTAVWLMNGTAPAVTELTATMSPAYQPVPVQ